MDILHTCVLIVIVSVSIVFAGVQITDDVTERPDVDAEFVTAHLCPHFCTGGDQIFCFPPPCPPPACVDPALHKPTDCCEYCPQGLDCRAPDRSIVLYKHWKIVGGKNCTCLNPGSMTTCKVLSINDVTEKPEVGAVTVTAHLCPFICTVGDQILCFPPPCPPPPCADSAKYKPTDCCDYCPQGPDCRAPDGSIVLYNHWKIVGGKNCTCLNPGSMETTCN